MNKLIVRFEALFKGVAFDCHACGQCVLSHTGIICLIEALATSAGWRPQT